MKSDWDLIEDAVSLAGLDEEFEEIIESLRAVARAARDVYFFDTPRDDGVLQQALDALPAWCLEE